MSNSPEKSLSLELLPMRLGVVKLSPSNDIPTWATRGEIWSITKTHEELSVICDEGNIPPHSEIESGWRALKVQGPLDFGLTGILASIAKPLAEARISIFAISTFNTDYVLVKQEKIQEATNVLRKAGHSILNI